MNRRQYVKNSAILVAGYDKNTSPPDASAWVATTAPPARYPVLDAGAQSTNRNKQ